MLMTGELPRRAEGVHRLRGVVAIQDERKRLGRGSPGGSVCCCCRQLLLKLELGSEFIEKPWRVRLLGNVLRLAEDSVEKSIEVPRRLAYKKSIMEDNKRFQPGKTQRDKQLTLW
jgi:hypothetical protein